MYDVLLRDYEMEYVDPQGEHQYVYPNLEIDMRQENTGIGGYEYMGSRGYDSGESYYEISNIDWNKEDFSDAENKVIEDYIEKNSKEIEQRAAERYEDMLKHRFEEIRRMQEIAGIEKKS